MTSQNSYISLKHITYMAVHPRRHTHVTCHEYEAQIADNSTRCEGYLTGIRMMAHFAGNEFVITIYSD